MSYVIYQQLLKFPSDQSAQAATITRHYQSREPLGSGLIITDEPSALWPAIQSQWQQLIRELQTLRDQATDTDEKLRLTNQVIRMQSGHPGGHIAKPNLVCTDDVGLKSVHPLSFKTVYMTAPVSASTARRLTAHLPAGALLVGPASPSLHGPDVQPKAVLDSYAEDTWQELVGFLQSNGIKLDVLSRPNQDRSQHIDAALECLLDSTLARQFLRLVATYRTQAGLATPPTYTRLQERERQTVAVLARQVQAFSGNEFDGNFLPGENDPVFYLNDEPFPTERRVGLPVEELSWMPMIA